MLLASRLSHNLSLLRSATAHLDCALGQTIPSDDHIIVEHMAAAAHTLHKIIADLEAHRDMLQMAASSPAGRTAA